MKVWTLGLALALSSGTVISTGTVEAQAASSAKKKAPALTQVRVCPMSGTPVQGNGAGSRVVGKYKVYFC